MKPLFKVGDYVRVKDGVELEELDDHFADNWQGKVLEIDEENDTVLIQLDAQTLDSLTDEYMRDSVEEEGDFEQYVFFIDNLEPNPVPRRDTDKLLKQALAKAQERYDEIEEEYEDDDDEEVDFDQEGVEELLEQWMKTPHFSALPKDVQDIAEFAIETFADYAYRYEDENFQDWSKYTVYQICINIISRKVSCPAQEIGWMADALVAFFDWMHLQKLHLDAKEMRDEARKVKPSMLKIAADPSQWDPAKSFLMGAIDAGIDTDDEVAMNRYLAQVQGQSLNRLSAQNALNPKPVMKESLYKNISSNTMITVRYENGKQKTDKFKRLEKDLSSGKCKLVSR